MTTKYREFLARYRCSNPQPPGDPRSPGGRRGGMLLACALLIVVAMAMAAAAAVSRGADRAAVVKLSDERGMLSGVIVDPSGLVLSVSHGQFLPDKTVNVRLHDGTETRARLVWPGELPSEDVVALRLPTGPVYPYASLAPADPPNGSIVWSFGYPAGTLDVLTGTVTSRVMVREEGKPGEPTPVIDTTIPARSGHSGGPLFNLAGEVSGLLWRSKDAATPRRVQRPGASMFVAVERARRAMEAAAAPGGPARQTLYAFTGELCEPCERFKRDFQTNASGLATALQREYRVEIVQRGGGGWSNPAAAAEYSRFMGQRLDTVPRFWISGTKHGAQGYAGGGPLLSWLAEYRPPVQPEPLRPEPAPAPLIGINDGWQPGGGEFAVPPLGRPLDVTPPIEWSTAKIIVLRSNPDLSATAAGALRLGSDQLGAPIRRRLNELTGSRADVEIIHEQVSPVRFAAVQLAIGQPVGRFLVVVLVKRQDVGMLKGAIVGRITGALDDYVRSVPVEVVSQRIHPQDFAAIETALMTVEPPADDGSYPWWFAVIAAVISAAVGYFSNRASTTVFPEPEQETSAPKTPARKRSK